MLVHNLVVTGSLTFPTSLPLSGSLLVSGSVSIGNNGNSSYKLLTTGNVASIDSNNQNTIFLAAGTSVSYIDTSYIGGGSYVPIAFGTNGSEKMRITTAGNIGIGTTVPVTLNSADANLTIYAGQDSSLTLKDSVENWEFYVNDDLYITTGSVTNTPTMTFKRITGYVGIGTSNPTHNFTIFNSGSTYMKIHADFGVAYIGMETTDDSYRFVTAQATNFQFYTSNIERVRIGATTSQYDLMIGGNTVLHPATDRGSVSINGPASAILSFGVANSAKGYVYHGGTAMYIENSISGGSLSINAGGSGGVVLNSGATSWVSASDIRLKNINSTIENAVDKLSTLRAVNFSWKSDETNKENLGLIAQDIEEVFPQVIERNQLPSKPDQEQTDETEYLGVKYTELIPVLVKAIQEQQTTINALTTRITALEN